MTGKTTMNELRGISYQKIRLFSSDRHFNFQKCSRYPGFLFFLHIDSNFFSDLIASFLSHRKQAEDSGPPFQR